MKKAVSRKPIILFIAAGLTFSCLPVNSGFLPTPTPDAASGVNSSLPGLTLPPPLLANNASTENSSVQSDPPTLTLEDSGLLTLTETDTQTPEATDPTSTQANGSEDPTATSTGNIPPSETLPPTITFTPSNSSTATNTPKPTKTFTPTNTATKRPIPRPNIILILTDDQAPHTLSFMPTLQKELIGKGIKFTNGFVTTPLCCPSRASILTGQYTHNHKVYTNTPPDGGAPSFRDSSTIATWLKNAGYRTAYIGKYLNNYNLVSPYGYIPPGWSDWQVFIGRFTDSSFYYNYDLNSNKKILTYGSGENDYSSKVITQKAEKFILDTNSSRPFFLFLSYFAPHSPFTPARESAGTYSGASPYRPPNFNESDVSDKPDWVKNSAYIDPKKADSNYRRSLETLITVDNGIKRILAVLDQTGRREDTMIIFLSDNGISFGEHRQLNQKKCAYEECIKVPFVIYYPKLIKSRRTESKFVLNIDLAPTIADLARIKIPKKVDGKSLMPIIKNQAVNWRDEILIEDWPYYSTASNDPKTLNIYLIETLNNTGSPYFIAIRTSKWKYVEYITGEIELYNLIVDPYELNNIGYKKKNNSIVQNLADRLHKLVEK